MESQYMSQLPIFSYHIIPYIYISHILLLIVVYEAVYFKHVYLGWSSPMMSIFFRGVKPRWWFKYLKIAEDTPKKSSPKTSDIIGFVMFCLDLGNEENVLWFIGGHGRMSVVGVGKYRSYQSVMTWGYMRIFTVQKLRPNESSALWNPVIVLGWYLHPPAVQAQDAALCSHSTRKLHFSRWQFRCATQWRPCETLNRKLRLAHFLPRKSPFWVRGIPFLQWFLNFPGDLRWDSKETHQRCHEERCSCQVPDLYWDGVYRCMT